MRISYNSYGNIVAIIGEPGCKTMEDSQLKLQVLSIDNPTSIIKAIEVVANVDHEKPTIFNILIVLLNILVRIYYY